MGCHILNLQGNYPNTKGEKSNLNLAVIAHDDIMGKEHLTELTNGGINSTMHFPL